jgi:hypothetical protein
LGYTKYVGTVESPGKGVQSIKRNSIDAYKGLTVTNRLDLSIRSTFVLEASGATSAWGFRCHVSFLESGCLDGMGVSPPGMKGNIRINRQRIFMASEAFQADG